MKIIVKKVDENAEIVSVEKLEYEDMKNLVGGYIEVLNVRDDIDMWLNEEGKLIPLPTNLYLCSALHEGKILDTIQGDIFFTSVNEDGETIGLNDEQIDFVMSELQSGAFVLANDPFCPDNSVKSFPVWRWSA